LNELAASLARPGDRANKPTGKYSALFAVVALLVVLGGLGATIYSHYLRELDPAIAIAIEPQYSDPITDLPIVADAPPPAIIVMPEPEPVRPLPPLDESDTELVGEFTALFGAEAIQRFLLPERIARNIVVTIDNLARQTVALRQLPIRPTPGRFVTSGTEDNIVLAPENYARYAAFITLVRNTDARAAVALYRTLRPLFQQAYEDLGYPSRSFNTRLVNVIDHLLETPTVLDPIRLVQPRVVYQYADPELEALSPGQKWLIRMGPANGLVDKAKLREIRAELLSN
jgi:hypothetical protein